MGRKDLSMNSMFLSFFSRLTLVLTLCFLVDSIVVNAQESGVTAVGKVSFVSDAPLERIEASSKNLKGAIQVPNKAFAFSVPVSSFQGFNSDIQRTHFLENYMLEKKYPTISFKGKWIEDVDISKPGSYEVRAKGILNIHGIEKERIIKGVMEVTKTDVFIKSTFQVPLSDHSITIPKVVYQKISDEIEVTMEIGFKK